MAARWLTQLRRFWTAYVDALERQLDRQLDRRDASTAKKGKTKTGRER